MKRVIKVSLRLIYWCSITHLLIYIFAVSLGQSLPIEFLDSDLRRVFYSIVLEWSPISTLLVLTGITKKTIREVKISLYILIPFFAIMVFLFNVSIMFTVGFNGWVEREVLYQQKAHSEIIIVIERASLGALGYGGYRVVKLEPFTPFFQLISQVDTLVLDPTYWTRVDQ